jgi:RNA polymerase sigma-70 factor (ECF subfamily)
LRLSRGNRVLADDLAQETFLRAYRGLPSFEGRARFGTWLHRIAYYVYLNHRNRTRPHAGLPDEFESTTAAPDDDLSPSRCDLRRDMHALVASLPDRYREVISMDYMAHVQYRDIADSLGVRLGTVKTQLHRAKALMRERLQSWDSAVAAA